MIDELARVVSGHAALALAMSGHCAVMCGPLAGAACARREGSAARFALYTAGRAASYAALGAVVGGAGGGLLRWVGAERASVAAALATALVLLAAAWRLARGHAPLLTLRRKASPHRVGPSLPLVLGARAPVALGLLTAILPCGALLSAALLASVAGSSALGATGMLTFALATSPAVGLAALVGRAFVERRRTVAVSALVLVACWAGARPWLAKGPTDALCRAPTAMR